MSHHFLTLKTEDDGLSEEEALLSKDPVTACIARGGVSKWSEQFTLWINDEIRRVGPSNAMQALAMIQVQAHASISAHLFDVEAAPLIAKAYVKLIELEYEQHMRRCIARLEVANEPSSG